MANKFFIETKTMEAIKNDIPEKFCGTFSVIIIDEKCIDGEMTLGGLPLVEIEFKEKEK